MADKQQLAKHVANLRQAALTLHEIDSRREAPPPDIDRAELQRSLRAAEAALALITSPAPPRRPRSMAD